MAMDIDPFSMLEVSLQEGPDIDDRRPGQNASSGVMHQVENDVQILQPPPPLHYFGSDVLTPQRAVLSNIQKLSSTSKDEEKFRRRAYSSISLVLRKRLHCTICDAHIGAYLGLKEMDIEHPLLKVLACPKCTLKYHYLDFPLNMDGRDVRCRWCTNVSKEDGPLRYCNYCPFAFCEMCIYRNLPLDELASNKSNWVCFVCNVKDLWPSRAVLWALRVLIDTNLALKEEKKWSTDQSTCCKNKMPKQRRLISLPQGASQPTNGHNVAVRAAVLPNQFRMTLQNNYRMPYNRAPTPSIIRPIVVPQQTAYRAIRPAVTVPVPAVANSPTQLYDTSWLTEKVSNISTTLLNLNNNLHRLAQGIPEKENKYSIKSKMISMVSLLNISATQLQKASKEMEEESKRILDKNYRVARITPVVPSENKPAVASTSKPVFSSLGKRPPPRSRSTSSKRSRRRRRASQADSDSDPDDPDFRTKAKLDGVSDDDYEVEEYETSKSFTRTYETRACFVKLERLDYKRVAGYESGSESESKSDAGSRSQEPQPSTSFATDPLGTVPPSELPDRRDADSGSGDAGDGGKGLKKEEGDEVEQKKQSKVVDGIATSKDIDDPATSKEIDDFATSKETHESATATKQTDDAATSKETNDSGTSKETDNSATPKETDGAISSKETDDAATFKEADGKTDDSATPKETHESATSEETDDAAASKKTNDSGTSKETDDSATPKETDDAATSKETNDSGISKETDDSETSNETDDSATSKETNDSETSKETDDSEECKQQSEPIHADEVTATGFGQSKDVTDESEQNKETNVVHKPSPTPDSEEIKPWAESRVDDNTANKDEENINSSTDTSSADSTLDTSGETSKSDSTETSSTD